MRQSKLKLNPISYVLLLLIIIMAVNTQGTLYANKFVIKSAIGNTGSLKRDLLSKFSMEFQHRIHSDFFLYIKRDLEEMSKQPWTSSDFIAFTGEAGIQWTQEWYEKISRSYFQSFEMDQSKGITSDEICSGSNITEQTLNALSAKHVWSLGLSGKGVVVAVVDNGVELGHVDLAANTRADLSYDFVRNIPDGNTKDVHSYPDRMETSSHGTKCAGLIASLSNDLCSTGVAPNASIASFVVLNPLFSVVGSVVSKAFLYQSDVVHIYSSSWGVDDEECGFSLLPEVTQTALNKGVKYGRNGKGNIYVFPSGNGGPSDNCNSDGYANSINTITISAANTNGSIPFFAEPCACVLASVTINSDCLKTTTLNNKCASKFVGTSAATALASGMIALLLQSSPNLTKRDVDNIIVESADPIGFGDTSTARWKTNGAKKRVSDVFGFGRLDASKLVEKAKEWKPVPPQTVCNSETSSSRILHQGASIRAKFISVCNKVKIEKLEYVRLHTELVASNLDRLTVTLGSPMGTFSNLMSVRRHKCVLSAIRFINWTFTSAQFWGENPIGEWTLLIKDAANKTSSNLKLISASILLYGYNSFEQDLAQSQPGLTSHADQSALNDFDDAKKVFGSDNDDNDQTWIVLVAVTVFSYIILIYFSCRVYIDSGKDPKTA